MNLAKINPTVKKTFQISAFETKVEEADYMSISVIDYSIGGKGANFELRFGVYNLEADQSVDKFKVLLRDTIRLTKEEIEDWGTDDSIIFEKISKKIGTSIVEIITADIHKTN